jgi:hypothetical protein
VPAALALALACAAPAGDPPELAALDRAAYVRDVHPIIEARCATLDCHGAVDRPLRLHSETGLRARDELRGASIEPAELDDNIRAVQAIDPGVEPADSLFLLKPLDAAGGGVDHEGGALWRVDDAQFACVLAWLDGTSDDPPAAAACAAAAAQVTLPP